MGIEGGGMCVCKLGKQEEDDDEDEGRGMGASICLFVEMSNPSSR